MTTVFWILLSTGALITLSEAFISPSTTHGAPRLSDYSRRFSNPVDEMDEDQKANLFQTMLRDLQIEQVPLLGCDAQQVHTLQAALWTTMAEMSEKEGASRVCMIFEEIPIAALQSFVDDFLILKTQGDQMEYLPELSRISVSLLGKGLGPAVVMETEKRTTPPALEASSLNEFACSASMKVFMDRMVTGSGDVGLGDEGSAPPIDYRFSSSADVCTTVSFLWNCVCEMLADESIGTICLLLPAAMATHGRFGAVSQLLSRSLCLYQGDSVLTLVHFHPSYDRATITPSSKPAFGHLPPVGWLGPMLQANGNDPIANAGQLLNYQRRSPVPAVNLVRNSRLTPPKVVQLTLDDGTQELASALEVYCPNAVTLSSIGEDALQEAQNNEIAMLQ